MSYIVNKRILTHQGVLAMLAASVAAAERIGQPQCIAIVDCSGDPLLQFKMTGAKYLSRKSALAKAQTAASIGAPSSSIPDPVRPAIAAATDGSVTGLTGGLPVIIEGELVGGIGIGSGSPDQDLDVARAALGAVNADLFS